MIGLINNCSTFTCRIHVHLALSYILKSFAVFFNKIMNMNDIFSVKDRQSEPCSTVYKPFGIS